MRAYAKGNAKALELLYLRHRDDIYRYLFFSVKDRVVADDLSQDVWKRVIEQKTQYRPEGRFRHWLFRIAHNLVTDHFRRYRPTEEIPESLQAETPGPEREVSAMEEARIVMGVIEHLPPEQQQAALLRFLGDASFEEIAELQGVGVETAKSRCRYAREKAREVLGYE